MKKILFISLITIISITTYGQKWVDMMLDPTISFFETQKEFNKYNSDKLPSQINGWKQFKRYEYFMMSHVDSDGIFRNENAANNYYQSYVNSLSTAKSTKGGAGNWSQIGPFGPPIGSGVGRANCIAFHPTNANLILIGSASGGIWKSVNAGESWATNTDGLENLGVSDIVFSESNPNIVYAATGDRDGGDTYSIGLIKSTDGGNSWQQTSQNFGPNLKRKIYKIIVDPANENNLFIATSYGLFKSSDGGTSWVQKKAGSFVYICFQPFNQNVIYAATANTVIKSINGGQTWAVLNIPFTTSRSRIIIGVTKADSSYLYVMAVKSSDNSFGGIYLSTNSGSSFQLAASSPNIIGRDASGNDNVGQGWYDLSLGVSQTNKNIVLVGGVNVWRSINAGTNWALSGHWTGNSAPYVHADIHEIKFSPHNPTSVWACTDGGLSVSNNNGGSWIEKNINLSIAQMYRMGASSTVSTKIMTGWQDNGSNYYFASNSWKKVIGGDGMECIIDYSNNNTMYGSLYYGNIRRSTNGGQDWVSISNNITATEQGAWVTPYIQNPSTPAILYAGFKNVYRTTNKGNTWTKISNFTSGLNLNALAIAPSNSSVIYTANNNYLYRTSNGGTSWTNISNFSAPGSVTYIAVHPNNPNKLWITLNGYSAGNKVFESSDGGTTWKNISGNLPNLPANTIAYEKNSADGLYVGLDVGVFYRDTILGNWITFMKNLPNVIVKELEIYYPDHKIRAATFGRGLWESPLYYLANSAENSKINNLELISVYPNPTSGILNLESKNTLFKDTKVEIFNATGSLIKSLIISNVDRYTLDLSDQSAGIYFINVSSVYTNFTKKFVLN